jgi:hypothetical protein
MRLNSHQYKELTNRISTLEKELAEEKQKNTKCQNVRLDEEQYNDFLEEITQRIQWSTNHIVDESRPVIREFNPTHLKMDGFSSFIKWSLAGAFITFGLAIIIALVNQWSAFWVDKWVNKIAAIIVVIAGLDSIILGAELFKEKDRNYVVSVFSALVALVALIVTLVK